MIMSWTLLTCVRMYLLQHSMIMSSGRDPPPPTPLPAPPQQPPAQPTPTSLTSYIPPPGALSALASTAGGTGATGSSAAKVLPPRPSFAPAAAIAAASPVRREEHKQQTRPLHLHAHPHETPREAVEQAAAASGSVLAVKLSDPRAAAAVAAPGPTAVAVSGALTTARPQRARRPPSMLGKETPEETATASAREARLPSAAKPSAILSTAVAAEQTIGAEHAKAVSSARSKKQPATSDALVESGFGKLPGGTSARALATSAGATAVARQAAQADCIVLDARAQSHPELPSSSSAARGPQRARYVTLHISTFALVSLCTLCSIALSASVHAVSVEPPVPVPSPLLASPPLPSLSPLRKPRLPLHES